ncbi:hypothetical protein HWC80_gp097 [Mycobacterium phage Indlulamithi]|uniref:Uncharacterized protein n=1 Tax=Mycobacterium phage Indlulamithi TaxID=2656582 RepID=A0A649VDG2_9CAUD|nr:hypothetical protein HWC80_gp097 [Mycobacterium phage Indlulamithi]QGJ90115.1 hypothetical protein PBI_INDLULAMITHI_77 [Mycobacterium phage Indlulamithi]
MGKKKRKPQGQQGNPKPGPFESMKQQEAVERLSRLLRFASAPPEPILAMLTRLGIPYHTGELNQELDGDPIGQKYLVIKAEDLEAGEKKNQAQGSVLARLYGPQTQNPQQVVIGRDTSHMPTSGRVGEPTEHVVMDEAKRIAPEDNPEDEYLRGIQG